MYIIASFERDALGTSAAERGAPGWYLPVNRDVIRQAFEDKVGGAARLESGALARPFLVFIAADHGGQRGSFRLKRKRRRRVIGKGIRDKG